MKKMPEGRRFKPGQSGNPKGRPKKENTWKYIFDTLLAIEDVIMPDGSKITRKQAIAIRMVQEALKGSIGAVNLICKYTDSSEQPTALNATDFKSNPVTSKVYMVHKETIESWNKRLQQKKKSL